MTFDRSNCGRLATVCRCTPRACCHNPKPEGVWRFGVENGGKDNFEGHKGHRRAAVGAVTIRPSMAVWVSRPCYDIAHPGHTGLVNVEQAAVFVRPPQNLVEISQVWPGHASRSQPFYSPPLYSTWCTEAGESWSTRNLQLDPLRRSPAKENRRKRRPIRLSASRHPCRAVCRRVWINRPPSAPPNSPATEPGSQLRLVDLEEGGEVRMRRTPGVSRGVLRGAMGG